MDNFGENPDNNLVKVNGLNRIIFLFSNKKTIFPLNNKQL